jgi:hypothetical protein
MAYDTTEMQPFEHGVHRIQERVGAERRGGGEARRRGGEEARRWYTARVDGCLSLCSGKGAAMTLEWAIIALVGIIVLGLVAGYVASYGQRKGWW